MRALLLVNGLGLGNATRCHALVQRLWADGAEIEVASSGNGCWYFEGRPEIVAVHELEALHYGSKDGRLSVWGTAAAAGQLLGVIQRNDARIAAIVARFRPDVAVIDSVYSVCAVRQAGVPIVALNNADVVHVSWHRFRDRPPTARAQFHVVEENDRRFHTWVPDRVVSPSLDAHLPELGDPFHRVGPIVRGGIGHPVREGPPRRVLVMLSGSVFGTPVALSRPTRVPVDVVGRSRPPGVPEVDGVTWHGKVRDSLGLVAAADLAVVNGGFSAVSELFCHRTPMVVVPVPNHAEQWVNARTVEALGVGAIGSEETLERDLLDGLARLDDWRAGYRALPAPRDGAAEAAAVVREVAAGAR